MSAKERALFGGSVLAVALAAGCVIGASVHVSVPSITASASDPEGPAVQVAEPTPTTTPSATPTATAEAPVVPVTTPSPEAENSVPAPGQEGPADSVPTPSVWPFTVGETITCGDDAAPAIDYDDTVGWWAYCEPALAEGPANVPTLPVCEYEDSDNCIWDARTEGNGEGTSFIAYEGKVYYLDPSQ